MPSRLINAAWPEISPPVGAVNVLVMPSTRVTRDVRAVRINGRDRFRVWIEVADFGSINSAIRALWDFDESHVGAGVDHSRIDRQTTPVDRLRAGRDVDIRADGFDLAVANHDGAVFDISAADGDDARIANRKHAARRNHALLRGGIPDLLTQNAEHKIRKS